MFGNGENGLMSWSGRDGQYSGWPDGSWGSNPERWLSVSWRNVAAHVACRWTAASS